MHIALATPGGDRPAVAAEHRVGLSVYGAHDLAFTPAGRLLVAMGFSTDPASREQLGPAGAAMGTIIKITGRDSYRIIGDLSAQGGPGEFRRRFAESYGPAAAADLDAGLLPGISRPGSRPGPGRRR